jgi:hypothetical protein
LQSANQMPYPVGMETTPKPVAQLTVNKNTASPQKPKCFVIIQIGEDGSPARKKSDLVIKHIIEKALGDKYHVQTADDIKQPGTVTVQIIEQLLEAPLVVADLSDFNANVYYELAIRHAVKKPVVHLITKGQKAPFDVSQMRYVPYEITDLDSVEAAWQELRQHVESGDPGAPPLTPIQFTQFVLETQTGQSANQNTGIIVNAVATAMSNISEELKSIKQLIERGSKPAPGKSWLWTNDSGDAVPLSSLGSLGGLASLAGLASEQGTFAGAVTNALQEIGRENAEALKKNTEAVQIALREIHEGNDKKKS